MDSQRRSRFRRASLGNPVAITARDIQVFRWLTRYRYLRSTYLFSFVGGVSPKRFTERLGTLFHEGFLNRPEQQWQFADARTMPVVYEIGAGAKRVLSDCGDNTGEARTFLAPSEHRQFAHSLLICECLASIEIALLGCPELRFIAWSEILARAPVPLNESSMPYRMSVTPDTAVVPDGLFGLEYTNSSLRRYRFFALEVDRGTMPISRLGKNQTSCLAKLTAYRAVIERQVHRACLGIPNLLVLTITTSHTRVANIMENLRRSGGDHPAFLFKTIGQGMRASVKPACDLLDAPWDRAGHPAMFIADAGF